MFGAVLNRLATSVRRAFSDYAAANLEPELVLDFSKNYYKTNNSVSTFSSAITFSRASNAVMTDGYGPELITNGSFTADAADWTVSTNMTSSVNNGVANITRSGSDDNKGVYQVVSTVIGKTYVLSFDTRNWSGSYIIVYRYGTGPTDLVFSDLTAVEGRNQIAFVADKSSMYIGFSTADGESFDLDDVSLREMPVLKYAPHNYFEYSEDWTNWSFQATLTLAAVANSATAPDGTTTADTLTAGTGTTGGPRYYNNYRVLNANEKITYRCWMKKGTGDYGYLSVRQSNSNVAGAEFDLSSGTVDSTKEVGNCTLNASSITDAGNGWYLCSITVTCTASATNAFYFIGLGDGSGVAGNGYTNYAMNGESIYAWGAHLYRSDLGGMVDNPDQPTARGSYVFTTSASEYLPRIGHHVYNGSAWVNEGLLAESEARTNLITQSNDFTNVAWNKVRASTPTLNAMGPDGKSNSAATITDDNGGGTGTVFIEETVTVGTQETYTFSVYAKKDQLNGIMLYHASFTTPANNGWIFNLEDGTFSAYSGTPASTATIENAGNGWYRCAITFTTDASDTAGNVRMYITNGTNHVVDRDGTSSILIYGAQFEEGTTPSSFIPTNGAAATTSAESFEVSAANTPWNDNYISIATEGRVTYQDTDAANERVFIFWQNGADELIRHRLKTDGVKLGQPQTTQEAGGVTDGSQTTELDFLEPDILVPFNLAARHTTTECRLAANGVSGNLDSDPTAMPDLESVALNLFTIFSGTIKTVRIWDQDLGDDGVVEATNPVLEPSLSLTFEGTGTNSFVVNDWSE